MCVSWLAGIALCEKQFRFSSAAHFSFSTLTVAVIRESVKFLPRYMRYSYDHDIRFHNSLSLPHPPTSLHDEYLTSTMTMMLWDGKSWTSCIMSMLRNSQQLLRHDVSFPLQAMLLLASESVKRVSRHFFLIFKLRLMYPWMNIKND